MKSKTLRTLTALGVILIITIGFFTNLGIGTLSAPGFSDISILCPLGALMTMLATKIMVPRALISVVVMILLIAIFARAFCAWVCPIPLVSKIRNLFVRKKKTSTNEITDDGAGTSEANTSSVAATLALTAEEQASLNHACTKDTKGKSACSTCAAKRGSVADARHFVLGGALISTAAFGFPVFCLVCPIGLTFATIFLAIRLFSDGDVTLSLIVVPALLIAEVVLFRKWCHKLCPLSALMSLVGKANKTFVPVIDDKLCLETSKGVECGLCGCACEEEIDPRHPELSRAAWSECTKCRACVDACPAHAITMPLMCKGDSPRCTKIHN